MCTENIALITRFAFVDGLDLRSVISAGETAFVLRGRNQKQYFHWEKYGISFSAPEGILPLSEICEVAITALAGGEFEFCENNELVSAVYAISIAKPLLKPLTVSIQHCVLLETPEQCNTLQFVRAPIEDVTLPYQFEPLPGGRFTPRNQYGSISCSHFCLIGISMRESEEKGEVNTSDEEDDSSQNSHNGEEVNTSDEENSSSQNPHNSEEVNVSGEEDDSSQNSHNGDEVNTSGKENGSSQNPHDSEEVNTGEEDGSSQNAHNGDEVNTSGKENSTDEIKKKKDSVEHVSHSEGIYKKIYFQFFLFFVYTIRN